uniref:homeodomain-interacting protein kinase 2-like n=1 Tax=Semicossyphus pulcher TaxID=241346 RepID=UPI0037E97C7C
MQGSEDLKIANGSILGHLYKVEASLGEGGFGVVKKCRNIETDQCVAIKVNKNDLDIFHQARQEIAILKKLRSLDLETCNIVKWNGYFFNKANICLNFELLDQSLYSYTKEQPDQCLPMTELRSVLYQMTTALSHLSSMGIVHADFKTDNVMVVDRHKKPLRVKLIDFGLAHPTYACQPGACVQTIWYRAPEVSLHIPFNEAIDMWSLGLAAAELAVGYVLYPGNMDYDVLSFIIATQGQPPDHVLDQGMDTDYYFYPDSDGPQRWRFKTPEEFECDSGFQPADTRYLWLKSLDDLEELMEVNRQNNDHCLLLDLIKRMLHLDPERRIKPQEVLQHPFLSDSLPQSSCADVVINVTDTEETAPKDDQQPSWSQTTGPDNILHLDQNTTSSLTDEPEDKTTEEVEIQPETKVKKVGWFRRTLKRIRKTFRSIFKK